MTIDTLIAVLVAAATTPEDLALAARLSLTMTRKEARALHYDAVQAHLDSLAPMRPIVPVRLAIAACARGLAIEEDVSRAEWDVIARDIREHQYRANPWLGQTAEGMRKAAFDEAAGRLGVAHI